MDYCHAFWAVEINDTRRYCQQSSALWTLDLHLDDMKEGKVLHAVEDSVEVEEVWVAWLKLLGDENQQAAKIVDSFQE